MTIGIDIGGTYIRITSQDQEIIKFKTKTFKESFIKICEAIDHLNSKKPVKKIGICLPGILDFENGKLIQANQLSDDWQNLEIIQQFKNKYPQAMIKIDNDVNVAALGQYLIQKNKPKSLVYISFSTGLGSGFILNGKIYHGFTGTAMELDNVIPDYNYDSQGYKSGVSYFVGGNCLIDQAKKNNLLIEDVKELFDLSKNFTNESVLNILKTAQIKIKSLLSTIIYLLNPEIIVIGGSIALNQKTWFEKIIQGVWTTTKDINYQTPIIFADNLDSATLSACMKI